MNKTAHLSFEQQLESLSLILERWIPILEEMESIEKNIEDLPYELEQVRQYIQDYTQNQEKNNSRSWLNSFNFKQSTNQEEILYLKLQSILASLDKEVPHLLFLEEKIKNVLCLREVTEALQERIKTQSSPNYLPDFSATENTKQFKQSNKIYQGIFQPIRSFWQNLINPKRFNKRMKFVFFFSLLLVWNIFSNFIYAHVIDNKLDVQISDMEHILENVEVHNFSDTVEKW